MSEKDRRPLLENEGRLDVLAIRCVDLLATRSGVNPSLYDNLVRPLVKETIDRVVPSEPVTITDIYERAGLLPRKPNKKRGPHGVR